jgi:hypothetical protein
VPSPFALVVFEIKSCCLPRLAWPQFSFMLLEIAGLTGMLHDAQLFSVKNDSCNFFVQVGLELKFFPSQPLK